MCGANKTKKLTFLNQRGLEIKQKKSFVLVGIALDTRPVHRIRNSAITVKSVYLQSNRT